MDLVVLDLFMIVQYLLLNNIVKQIVQEFHVFYLMEYVKNI